MRYSKSSKKINEPLPTVLEAKKNKQFLGSITQPQFIISLKRAKAFSNFGRVEKKGYGFFIVKSITTSVPRFFGYSVPKAVKSVKFTPTNSAFILVIVCSVASCMDRVPDVWRKSKELAKTEYYGYRADKRDEIESAYLGAQAACCGPDKINDDLRALELYCKAASYGHAPSMVEIARFYSHKQLGTPGSAIPYDASLAYAYYVKAAENNYPAFVAMRDGFRGEIREDEAAKGDELVKRFPDISCAITK